MIQGTFREILPEQIHSFKSGVNLMKNLKRCNQLGTARFLAGYLVCMYQITSLLLCQMRRLNSLQLVKLLALSFVSIVVRNLFSKVLSLLRAERLRR